MTRARGRALLVVTAVVLVAAAALSIGALDRSRRQADLTADSDLTLTADTAEVVKALHGDVAVTALLAGSESGRAEAIALLERYHRLDRRITVRVADPAEIPGDLRRLGVDPNVDALVAQRGDRIERATTITEQDITAALARLERDRHPTVCFASGHGEPAVDDTTSTGIETFAASLARNGAVVQPLDLLTRPEIPAACRAVVLDNPTVAIGDAGAALAAYLAVGGRALVLADPTSTVDLAPLIEPYKIGLDRGIVLEGDEEARLPRDPVTVVARSFPTANPLVRGLAPLVLPAVQALKVADSAETTVLVRTTPLAYLERDPASPSYDPARDRPGPLPLAAAADVSRNDGGTITRTRLVVVGDSDLAANGVVGQGDDGRFLLQAVDWLTADDDLVSINANLARVRPLQLTASRARYARLLLGAVVPSMFLLVGLAVALVRRRR